MSEHDIDPRDLGLPRAKMEDLLGGTPQENAEVVHRVMAGERGPVRDIVLLNSAAGLVSYDLASKPDADERPLLVRLREGIERAEAAIDSGAAAAKLEAWATATSRQAAAQ